MLLLYFSFCGSDIFSQELISGVINRYAKVNSISPGFVTVNPAQASQFTAGDYVLLIQMQGVGIQTIEDNSYGLNVQSKYGEPGGYEFLIVQSVIGRKY